MQNLICPICGAENNPGTNHCQECGADLKQASKLENTDEKGFTLPSDDGQDLPDLLHALKRDGEISSDGQIQDEGSAPGELELKDSDQAQEADVPDWLKRIRERSKQETDAAGEITQKLTAAQESLAEDRSTSQHEDFASWIQGLKGDAVDESLKPPPQSQSEGKKSDDEGLEGTPAWLSKIRKVKGPAPGEGRAAGPGLGDNKGDSLLQWLVALEEGQETIKPIPEQNVEDGPKRLEETGPETSKSSEDPAAATQKIPVIAHNKQTMPEVEVSREEQISANLFSSLVVDEDAQRPLRKPAYKGTSWIVRLGASVLMIGLLSLALFGGWFGEKSGNTSPAIEAMLTSIEGGPEMDALLVVSDYRAGFAEEIHQIARPVFEAVLTSDMEIMQISTQPASVLLSRRLLAELSGELNLAIKDFGYYPSPMLGAYAAGGGASQAVSWVGLPKTQSGNLPIDLDGVFILADSYEGASFWVEQFTARKPTLPLYLLVTAQAGPMLRPYQDSGQVAALIAGISEINVANATFDGAGSALHIKTAYQTGMLLLAATIVLGAIFSIKPRNDEKKEGDL